MVADDVQHHFQACAVQSPGQPCEVQVLAGEVLIKFVEVDAPVAVVAGLATVGQRAGAADRLAAGVGLIGGVDVRRDPLCAEAKIADVLRIV
ncbi:hypothetical protein G6F46_015330 [Rhizopus delemar]|nr:hypothetical protein G6F46_015330 [Rhizopus delemar]